MIVAKLVLSLTRLSFPHKLVCARACVMVLCACVRLRACVRDLIPCRGGTRFLFFVFFLNLPDIIHAKNDMLIFFSVRWICIYNISYSFQLIYSQCIDVFFACITLLVWIHYIQNLTSMEFVYVKLCRCVLLCVLSYSCTVCYKLRYAQCCAVLFCVVVP